MGRYLHRLNPILDASVRSRWHLGNWHPCAFQVCGVAGLAAGWGVATCIAWNRGVPILLPALFTVAAVAVFLALAMLTKIFTGGETLIYYHHEVALFLALAVLAFAFHLPVAMTLDLAAIGLGTFLAFGRIGCLMAGCCHGRPASWGVRYGRGYELEGFPPEYIDVRLFPVQLAETIGVVSIVLVCVTGLLRGWPDGVAFTCYVAAYAVVRFCLEFLRGDSGRRVWLNFSEPQWTSVILFSLALASLYPAVLVCPIGFGFYGRMRRCSPLLRSDHLAELAAAVRRSRHRHNALVETTSQGLAVSSGSAHYSLSCVRRPLAATEQIHLARFVAALDARRADRWVLHRGAHGVLHVIHE